MLRKNWIEEKQTDLKRTENNGKSKQEIDKINGLPKETWILREIMMWTSYETLWKNLRQQQGKWRAWHSMNGTIFSKPSPSTSHLSTSSKYYCMVYAHWTRTTPSSRFSINSRQKSLGVFVETISSWPFVFNQPIFHSSVSWSVFCVLASWLINALFGFIFNPQLNSFFS